jgi:glycosyltransferase involved in cell wall biosynthesis
MRVVVCTVVHHPADARIFYRQIRALLDAGHEVTYIAPVGEPDFHPDERDGASLRTIAIPRAAGRRRLGALLAARRALAAYAPAGDLLLIHDPELLLVLPPRRRRPPVVWDVHEDTAAALTTKAWLPRWIRRPVAAAVRFAERVAERRLHLILADAGYQERFSVTHPVVPNTTYVPAVAAPPSGRRVIYVGLLSPDRGVAEMIALGRLLAPSGVAVELVGPADAAARLALDAAGDAVRWHGFVPNDVAMAMVDGALAGLSLLRDEANFRASMPTKVVEYMARGVPVITTPLPLAAGLVEKYDSGFVVPFEDPAAARDAVLALDRDPELRDAMARRGHDAALSSLGWPSDAAAFIARLESWAAPARALAGDGADPEVEVVGDQHVTGRGERQPDQVEERAGGRPAVAEGFRGRGAAADHVDVAGLHRRAIPGAVPHGHHLDEVAVVEHHVPGLGDRRLQVSAERGRRCRVAVGGRTAERAAAGDRVDVAGRHRLAVERSGALGDHLDPAGAADQHVARLVRGDLFRRHARCGGRAAVP